MQGVMQDHGAIVIGIIGVVLGPAGATWAVLRWRMKGAEERADRFETKLDTIIAGQSDHEKRLYLVESWLTKLPCVKDPKKYWEEYARRRTGG